MTIAQQLNIKEFPFEIRDKDGNLTYYEDSTGDWWKREYNSNSNEIYFESSFGYWEKSEYDSKGNQIYFENSYGKIRGNRPKEITNAEIAEKLEEIVKLLKPKL